MADIYLDNIVIHDRRSLKIVDKNNLDEFIVAIKNIFPDAPNILVKHRRNQERDKKYQKLGSKNKTLLICEDGVNFNVNLSDYIDTGLFLDHRPLRKWIKKEANEKSVLNLLCNASLYLCGSWWSDESNKYESFSKVS